jgi:hypothetical protein
MEDGDSLRLRPTWFFGELGQIIRVAGQQHDRAFHLKSRERRLKILQVHLQQGTISREEYEQHPREMGSTGSICRYLLWAFCRTVAGRSADSLVGGLPWLPR